MEVVGIQEDFTPILTQPSCPFTSLSIYQSTRFVALRNVNNYKYSADILSFSLFSVLLHS